uniref:Uncharacterized protein n=1 Tax=Romanomermis culicivorax TaxID=13658 RepID=A0A915KZ24_ROMCU
MNEEELLLKFVPVEVKTIENPKFSAKHWTRDVFPDAVGPCTKATTGVGSSSSSSFRLSIASSSSDAGSGKGSSGESRRFFLLAEQIFFADRVSR